MVLYNEDKKKYVAPYADIEYFLTNMAITTSGPLGGQDSGGGEVPDPDGTIDAVVYDVDTKEVKAFLDEDANEIDTSEFDTIY